MLHAELLDDLGRRIAAGELAPGSVLTADLGGSASTAEVTAAVCAAIRGSNAAGQPAA